jgi:hypothetical protein
MRCDSIFNKDIRRTYYQGIYLYYTAVVIIIIIIISGLVVLVLLSLNCKESLILQEK